MLDETIAQGGNLQKRTIAERRLTFEIQRFRRERSSGRGRSWTIANLCRVDLPFDLGTNDHVGSSGNERQSKRTGSFERSLVPSKIIFSMDEVNFVQQLVYYIERAYRTPDYGIWERGSKYNTNTCELHAR